jgi:alpha-galactosidase
LRLRTRKPLSQKGVAALAWVGIVVAAALCWFAGHGRVEAQSTEAQPLAATPPMGWNSWDAYGTTIDEADFKANAAWFARYLKPFGWQYVVVDMEWYVTNPVPEGNSKTSQFSIDEHGRYIPAVNRFPSSANGAGFKPLAEYAHSLGLKFGIHILRGIPKEAVAKNLPIEGTAARAGDVSHKEEACPWNPDNYALDMTKPAAQGYYDSIMKLYAQWGVDFIKADCEASRPYNGDDIRMLDEARRKTGRAMVLSLSPGEAPVEKLTDLREHSELWRISDDIWDLWHSTVAYPQGLGDQFPRIVKWAPLVEQGHWPDADMLAVGYLGPAPGWGKPRQTQLTHDEQRTLLTLWSVMRSPLMVGANLTKNDAWTTSLLTNPEVIGVDQRPSEKPKIIVTEANVIWVAKTDGGTKWNVAVFNLQNGPQKIQHTWKDLGMEARKYTLRNLWEHADAEGLESLDVTLPAHGCALYRASH